MTENTELTEFEKACLKFTELKKGIETEFSAYWDMKPCKWFFRNHRQRKLLDEVTELYTKDLAKVLRVMLEHKFPYTYDIMNPKERGNAIMSDPEMRQVGELVFDIDPKENSFLIEFNRKGE